MRVLAMVTALAVGGMAVAGCQTQGNTFNPGGWGTGQTVGTVGGAAAGGLLGSQIGSGSGQLAATAIGTLLGAFVGNQLGSTFDQNDVNAANAAGNQAFNTGQPTTWQSQQYSGDVQPNGQTFIYNGRECQNFTQTLYTQGYPQQSSGMACRNQYNGAWEIVQYY